MNITIFRQEEGDRFLLTLTRDDSKKVHSFAFDLDTEELKLLNEKISEELKDLNKPEEEIVWNPKSQRHEKVVKK